MEKYLWISEFNRKKRIKFKGSNTIKGKFWSAFERWWRFIRIRILTENNIKHVGYFSNDKKEGYGASFFIEKGFVLLGKWVNDKMEGVALIFSKNFNEDKNNINFDDNIKNEKIVMMKEGNIINGNLSDDDINKIKNDQVYNDLIKLYKDKFIPEFYKPINISY